MVSIVAPDIESAKSILSAVHYKILYGETNFERKGNLVFMDLIDD